MGNPHPARRPSTIENRTVTPRRPRNADLREREYLTPKEVDRLQDAARKHSRYGHRDAAAILWTGRLVDRAAAAMTAPDQSCINVVHT